MSKAELKQVKVVDHSVNNAVTERRHDVIVNGKVETITFKHGKPTLLPMEVGMKFMMDGFSVLDPETEQELRQPAVIDETLRLRLKPDEIVANLEELTVAALRVRAAKMRGGELLVANNAEKPELINFLKSGIIAEVKKAEASTVRAIVGDAPSNGPAPQGPITATGQGPLVIAPGTPAPKKPNVPSAIAGGGLISTETPDEV